MKVLVTGAAGLLGRELVLAICPGYETAAAGRSKGVELPVPFRTVDLSDEAATLELMRAEKPDVILHAAGIGCADACEREQTRAVRDNFDAARHVTTAANEIGAALIFFSTANVFDGKKKWAYSEDDATKPINVYGRTKLLAETYIRENARRYSIFRLGWLYGMHPTSFALQLLEAAAARQEFDLAADQWGRPTYAADIADFVSGILRDGEVLEKASNQTFHLGNSGLTSWAGFAEFLFNIAYYRNHRVTPVMTRDTAGVAPRPRNAVLAISKAKETLGQLRSWEEAARDFVGAYMARQKPNVLSPS